MSTSYTLRSRPSTTYSGRVRPNTEYAWRSRKTKFKTYLIGYNDSWELVYVCDQDWNKIVIYADTWFEQVEYNDWTLRNRI